MISKQHTENPHLALKNIEVVLNWKIISADNILIALMNHNLDKLAIQYMGYYAHFLDKDLFNYCLMHGNNIFLQNALLVAAFDKMIFREEIVID